MHIDLNKTLEWTYIINLTVLLSITTIAYRFGFYVGQILFFSLLIINSALYLSIYIYQRKIQSKLIDGNINVLLFLVHTNPRPKPKDIIDLINSSLLKIPENINTHDKNAHFILERLNQTPYLYTITKTIQDHEKLRFSWIRALIDNKENFIRNLSIGDFIFYHNNKDVLSNIVMHVTGCYWSHVATYIGNGQIVHTDLSGTVTEEIEVWLSNEEVEIAVLRSVEPKIDKDAILERTQDLIGTKYSYKSAFETFWTILTFKKGTGLLNKQINSIAISIFLVGVGIILLNFPILSFVYFGILFLYLKSLQKHWIIYSAEFETIIKTSNEKS